MKSNWLQLKEWLRNNANSMYEDLNSGADQGIVHELEKMIKTALPESFKVYLKSNNGQFGRTGPVLMQDWELMGIEFIIKTWKKQNEIFAEENYVRKDETEKTQSFWWDEKWLPIASNGGGDYLCIDLNPGSKGKLGQIIVFWHSNPFRKVIANSWDELLAIFISDLLNQKYRYEVDELFKL